MKPSTMIASAVIGLAVVAGAGYALTSGQSSQSNKDTVALVTFSGSIDDKSFNQSAWEGLTKWGKDNQLEKGANGYDYYVSNDAKDIKSNVQQAVSAKFKNVIGVGFLGADAMKQVADANPKVQFTEIDSVIDGKNIASVMFKTEEPSYLAGVAAAKTSKTGKVGFIGGIKGDILDTFEAGFVAGVKSVKPNMQVDVQYVNSFTDAAKAKLMAQTMYSSGADIIFQAAGTAGNGVFTEARAENEKMTANDRMWVIGVDRDQTSEGNYTDKDGKKSNFTLTSAVKRVDVAVEKILDLDKSGKFPAGKTTTYDLKAGGVEIARGSMSDDAWNAVQEAKQMIIDGKTTVPAHP